MKLNRIRTGNTITGQYIRWIVLTLPALAVGACTLLDPSPEATVTYPVEIDCDHIETVTGGREIYTCKCASCHGLQGESVTPDVTVVAGWDDRQDFDVSLDEGPGVMPAFPELSDQQRDSLFLYMRDILGK